MCSYESGLDYWKRSLRSHKHNGVCRLGTFWARRHWGVPWNINLTIVSTYRISREREHLFCNVMMMMMIWHKEKIRSTANMRQIFCFCIIRENTEILHWQDLVPGEYCHCSSWELCTCKRTVCEQNSEFVNVTVGEFQKVNSSRIQFSSIILCFIFIGELRRYCLKIRFFRVLIPRELSYRT